MSQPGHSIFDKVRELEKRIEVLERVLLERETQQAPSEPSQKDVTWSAGEGG